MNAFLKLIRRGWQPRHMALAFTVISALAVVLVFTFAFAAPASAGGGCESTMADNTPLFEIEFAGGVTETLPGPAVLAGQVLCVEADGDFDIGFKSAEEFLLNGGHVKPSSDATDFFDGASVGSIATFMITGANVETNLQWAPTDMATIVAYVGELRPSPRQTPPPAATQPTPPAPWLIVNLPQTYEVGDIAKWELKPISGTVTLEISSKVEAPISTPHGVVTPTLGLSGWYEFRETVVEGAYSVPALSSRTGYWQARLSGSADAILRMKVAPAPKAPPATTTVAGKIGLWKSAAGNYFSNADCSGGALVFDPARHDQVGTCGGGRGKIAGAPARLYLPTMLSLNP